MDWVHHPWTGHCAVVFTGPPWTSSRREQRAHRSIIGRLVLRETLHHEWGGETHRGGGGGGGRRGRRPSGSSPEADEDGAMTVVPRPRRVEVAVRGARWEGNTGADGAS
jgi:hypothetical protein